MFDIIVYFMDNYTVLGGAANTLLRQVILMKHIEKSVHVVVSKYKTEKVCEDYVNICQSENIPVYELGFSVSNRPDDIDVLAIIECYESIKEFLKEKNPDIVHSVQMNPVVELACRALNIPHVMDIYQGDTKFFPFHYVDIFPHYHICDSEYYALFWHQYLGTKSYCVRTVAEKSDYVKGNIDLEKIRFICVGHLCEWKNQLEIIKAFELVLGSGINGRLQFWGHCDSTYAEQCRKYIADNKLQDYITINGFSKNMYRIYQDSDVLICGSMNESYPNVISEAFANGIVIISSPVAGIPEIVKDRENGYLCKGYTAKDIAESIFDFYEDLKTDHIHKILKNAEKTFKEVHSYEAVTRQLSNVYNEIQADFRNQSGFVYSIEDYTNEFKGTIDNLLKNENILVNKAFVKKNLWKIYFVIRTLEEEVLVKHRNCYIWGTGKYGQMYKEIMDIFAEDIRITGFIDSYKTGNHMGYKVFSPDDILNHEKSVILISVADNKSIIQKLDSCEYQYGIDYFVFGQIPW